MEFDTGLEKQRRGNLMESCGCRRRSPGGGLGQDGGNDLQLNRTCVFKTDWPACGDGLAFRVSCTLELEMHRSLLGPAAALLMLSVVG